MTTASLMDTLRASRRVFSRSRLATAGALILLLVVLSGIFAPWIAPYDPAAQSRQRLEAPSATHWLGTDQFGRDTFSRIVFGTRISVTIAFVSVAVAALSGTLAGVVAGYAGSRIDELISKVADGILAFPSVLVGVVVLVIFGPGTYNVAFALAVAFFPRFLRLARAETLALRNAEFIEAARALGASNREIIVRHILPNVASSIITMATLWAAAAIRLEAGLSFLGLGAQPPTPSWGLMLKDGMANILFSPWLAFFPGLAIFITVLALNMVGDGLRDILDPDDRNL